MSNVKNKKSDKAQEEKLENRVLARQLSRKLTKKDLQQVSGGKMCCESTDRKGGLIGVDCTPC